MTMTDVQTEPPRNGRGQYLIPDPETHKNVACSRATTVAKAIEDQGGLINWKGRVVALGLSARPDLLSLVPKAAGNKTELGKLCEQAAEAGGATTSRNRGTAIHHAVECHNRGLEVPPAEAIRVAQFAAAVDEAGFDVVAGSAERVVAHIGERIAGMFDFVLRQRSSGTIFVADLKTGSVDYPHSFAVQLAIYATATVMLTEDYTATVEPYPFDQDRGIIVHLPSDGEGCTLHWIDLAAGRDALGLALRVRKYRSNRNLLSVVVPDDEPEPTESDLVNELKAFYPVVLPTKHPGHAHRVRWTDEAAHACGGTFQLRADPTRRRTNQILAMWRIAAFVEPDDDADDVARALLTYALGTEVQPAVTVGMAISALEVRESQRLIDYLDSGLARLTFDADGTPKFT